jgi:hypothetical protein
VRNSNRRWIGGGACGRIGVHRRDHWSDHGGRHLEWTQANAFALIHDSMELFYPERWTTNPPYASSISLTNPTAPFSNPWLGYPGGNPFPGAAIFPVAGTYVTIPPDVKATFIYDAVEPELSAADREGLAGYHQLSWQ